MGKYRFTFTNILFWVAIIASILVFENITFFEKGTAETFMLPGMQDPYFFMLFGIAAFCFVALILYETFFNRAKVNKLALVVCLTVLVCGIIGIYSFNGMTFSNGAAPIVVTEWDKIKHVLSFVLFVLTVYSTVFYFNKNHPSIKRLRFLFLIIVLVTYFFVIYSIATEYRKYEMIANTKLDEEIPHVSVQSLFQKSNMFAGFILMGICAAMGLNYFKKNPLSYISIIGFSIVQVFACSLTSIIITITGTLLYFLAEIIADFKKYKTGPVPFVKLTIVLIAYVAIILMFCLAQTYDVGAVTAFCRYLYRELSTSDFNSFTNRREIWEAAIGASNQNITTLLFGYGFRNSEYIVGGLMNVDDHRISCHNGYLQLLLNFGVIGLVAFGVFVFVYLFSLIRLFRRHLRFSLIFLIIGFSYFALATMESIIAFNANATGIIIGASFYLPVINRYRHFRHKEVGDYAIDYHSSPKLLEPKLVARMSTRLILSLMAIVGVFFIFDDFRSNTHIYYSLVNASVVLGLLFFSWPYLNALWAKTGHLYKYLFHALLFVIPLALLASGSSVMIFTQGDNANQGYIWICPAAFILYLLLEISVYSIIMHGSFKLYLNTFVGIKTSLGSLIGAGGYIALAYYVRGYLIPDSMITYLLLSIGVGIFYYSFSFITPFKDLFEIVRFQGEFDANLMKIDIIRDRLEEPYEI